MAEKKKKGEAVQYGDFELDDATIARIQQERADAASRVAQFNKTFVPTGSAFKDTNLLSGTSRDVKTMRLADQLLDKAADRRATVRGQDIQLELGRGEIDVNKDRNRIIEKGYDYQHEIGMGGLELNKDIFKATQDRYRNIGKPLDEMNLTERYAEVKKGLEDIGFDAPILEKYEGKYGKSVAKPAAHAPGQQAIQQNPVSMKNAIPFAGYAPYPQVLEAEPITHYGKGILPQIGGSAVEGIKLLGRTAARITAADPLTPSNRYKRKVKK